MVYRGMGPVSFNGMAATGTNPGMWLSMDEEEFARELRRFGMGPVAIENEMAMLRTYKAQFLPTRPLKPPIEVEPEQAEQSTGLRAVVGRRLRMKNMKAELEGVEDGD